MNEPHVRRLRWSGNRSRVAACLLAVVPLVGLAEVLLNERPVWVAENDVEHGYFFNALLFHEGEPLAFVAHPGTPVIYLSQPILRITGSDFTDVDAFRRAGYALGAVFLAAAVAVVVLVLLPLAPAGVVVAGVALALGWPATWSGYEYFGPESLLLGIALLLTATLAGLFTSGRTAPSHRTLIGVVVGIGLAVKLTFLPLAVAALVATGAHAWLTSSHAWPKRVIALLLAPGAAAVTFLLLILPVFGRIPQILAITFLRRDARPSSIAAPLSQLLDYSPVYTVLFLLSVLVVAAGLFTAVHGVLRARRKSSSRSVPSEDFSTPIFVALALAGISYTIAAAEPTAIDAGVTMRNVLPSIGALPFAIVFTWRTADRFLRPYTMRAGRLVRAGGWVLAVVALGSSFTSFRGHRATMIAGHVERAKLTRGELVRAQGADELLAVWDGSPGTLVGPESFHFWGNYNYASGRFAPALRETFPHIVWFPLRDVARTLGGADLPENLRLVSPAPPWSHAVRDTWRRWFPPVATTLVAARSYANAATEAGVVLIAIPRAELEAEIHGHSIKEMLDLAHPGAASAEVEYRDIAGIEWVLIRVAGITQPSQS